MSCTTKNKYSSAGVGVRTPNTHANILFIIIMCSRSRAWKCMVNMRTVCLRDLERLIIIDPNWDEHECIEHEYASILYESD